MRVVVDARPAIDPRPTGIGRYARRIVEHLPAAMDGDEVVAWYLHARGALRPRTFFAPDRGVVERPARFPARLYGPLAWRVGRPRVERFTGPFDVLLGTNFVPPPTARPAVPVVHDLAFVAHPETAPQVDDRFLRRLRAALGAAPAVIVPSRAVADDLHRFVDLGEGRVHVVAHGVDAIVAPVDAAERRRRLGVDGPYVLWIGGLEPRKNVTGLVDAFGRLDGDVRLVLAGGAVRWFPAGEDDVRRAVDSLPPAVRGRVTMTGYVDDDDRAALLVGARAFAYPSLSEGFGLPVLEAMSAGVPVVTSDRSALPEVAGDAALLADPLDADALAAALRTALADDGIRHRLIGAGRARADAHAWDACARATAAVLRAARR